MIFLINISFNCTAEQFDVGRFSDKSHYDLTELFDVQQIRDGKVYLSPGSVYVAPEGILVNVNGQLFPVSSISNSPEGVYCLIDDFDCAIYETWECPRCGHINNRNRVHCVNCNRERK